MPSMKLFVTKVDLRETIPIGFDSKPFLPCNCYDLINKLLEIHIGYLANRCQGEGEV